jgi:hypothetical protein
MGMGRQFQAATHSRTGEDIGSNEAWRLAQIVQRFRCLSKRGTEESFRHIIQQVKGIEKGINFA